MFFSVSKRGYPNEVDNPLLNLTMGGSVNSACFIRKNKNVAMQYLNHDRDNNIHADLFECPECEGFIEVGG
ncbi:hypothetical protein [Shewanella surugensis]|uniref:Uncharacterized protein n=1 Tax=Shewanella surugensis TaxID=212020 RepID=A0ABT0L5P0_9GAMM|nr:hypothetical protein [Shewanella surugensis]MCL1123002.1 hypothetical protein [Shewanella surugensis]